MECPLFAFADLGSSSQLKSQNGQPPPVNPASQPQPSCGDVKSIWVMGKPNPVQLLGSWRGAPPVLFTFRNKGWMSAPKYLTYYNWRVMASTLDIPPKGPPLIKKSPTPYRSNRRIAKFGDFFLPLEMNGPTVLGFALEECLPPWNFVAMGRKIEESPKNGCGAFCYGGSVFWVVKFYIKLKNHLRIPGGKPF